MPSTTATRYRCTACGNLTRFDVTEQQRTRSFHHYTVGGELVVEETEVLSHEVESVSCRWCGSGANVVTEAAPAEPAAESAPGDTAR